MVPALATRKMQTSQSRRNKRKSAMAGLDKALDAPGEDPSQGKNLLSKLDGEVSGSFAIADLGSGSNVQTQHLPDGKIALTLKAKDQNPQG